MAKTVTIRLLDGKEAVYDDFKLNVIDRLHSDVCYVTTMLMEVFNQALEQNPKAEPVMMKFVKQNIQINMGCTFQYYTKKARRTPQDDISTISDRDSFIPRFTEQFPTMRKKAQDFWIEELKAQGWDLTPPGSETTKRASIQETSSSTDTTVSTAKPKGIINALKNFIHRIVKQLKALGTH